MLQLFYKVNHHFCKPRGRAYSTGTHDPDPHILGRLLQLGIEIPNNLHMVGDETNWANHNRVDTFVLVNLSGVINNVGL